MKLSVLDQSAALTGRSEADSIRETLALASFCESLGYHGQGAEQALDVYRRLYQPSARHPKPEPTLCVWALAADTEQQARHHALSRDRWRVDRQRGVFGPLQAPDVVAAQGFSSADQPTLDAMHQRAFVGTAVQVGTQLRALADAMQLDELVVNTWAHDPAVRRHSYALLAREFALDAPSTSPSCN